MPNIGTNPCRCRKCGHEWLSHSTNPKACSSCGSGLWNTDRIYRGETLEEKFWARVQKTESCWIWTGYKIHGYGNLRVKKGTVGHAAHRLSWEIHKGPIPEGLWVLHNCPGGDNPACVNPDHLWLGTESDNNKDCVKKKRNQRGERHGNAVLTWQMVCQARKLKSEGNICQREIAKMFGIGESHLSQILLGKIWKDSGEIPSLHSYAVALKPCSTER